ncbi:hypothetical protein [Frankia sp. Cj5]|uniref:hypothetical protein n=1 Tax=Frankia sp. Cj5 TaxID=2880978 RepID=UPI001EF4483A|nr:hypothetical protein [Frankia sp. Cj5]
MSSGESAPRPQPHFTTAPEKSLYAEINAEVCRPWPLRRRRVDTLTTIYRTLTEQELPETARPANVDAST